MRNNNFSIYGKKIFPYNFYSDYDDRYDKEIMDLRKIVSNESLFFNYGIVTPDPIFVTNIINKINDLMKKMKIYNNYENNKSYIILSDMLNELDYYKEKNILQDEKNILQDEIDRLKKVVQGHGANAQTFTAIEINTVIKVDYAKYIIHFGVPEDGIFDPLLLAAVKCMD